MAWVVPAPQQLLRAARVMQDDPASMVLEVVKDGERPLTVFEGDVFLTVGFLRPFPGLEHHGELWLPWQA